jgi:xanthine dehydrogenase molybdopterin-binding subunit B
MENKKHKNTDNNNLQHVRGKSVFVSDIPETPGTLHGRVVYSPYPHARIISFNIDKAKNADGIHAVLCYQRYLRVKTRWVR